MQTLRSRIGRVIAATALAATGGMLAVPAAAQAVNTAPTVAIQAAESALFEFTDTNGQNRFVIQLTDQAKIDHARRILSGEEKNRIHPHGRIIKRAVPYNPGWSYHLDPATIDFFEVAIEVCDASIVYTEDHLDEAGGPFLPGGHWCPWSSRLTREIK
ncbi:hypothetical protein [Actinoplanes sp. NBRC 101535]|uniref:BP74-related protein n=1 Tax=Actinoplanes sp. NBRC 101535 TaxID=3032196 RepID=UPI0024A129FE|nr:hypothetical protein [Actinoplanes sp. NBRC 101535]GLX99945.1 hypothetical protein Acsp01_03250 [Actinoplanes sp. NBRC 101535]